MNERSVDHGTRSPGDFFMGFHEWRKTHPYMFYCKNCVRNFEKKQRVTLCPYCKREDIVELPKNWVKINKHDYVEISFAQLKKKIGSLGKRTYFFLKSSSKEETPSVRNL